MTYQSEIPVEPNEIPPRGPVTDHPGSPSARLGTGNHPGTRRRTRGLRTVVVASVLAVIATAFTGCSSDSDDAAAGATSDMDQAGSTPADRDEPVETSADVVEETEPLRILVSNDDGFDAPGIDAVVRALADMNDTEVVVSAPATQQSGKGSTTTDGELEAGDGETISGHSANVVHGTPADSVNWALDGGLDFEPHLVIAGINAGQNLGLIADKISGTIGAARAGTAHGIPALAVSLGGESPQTINDPVDIPAFEIAAGYVVEWVKEHRSALISGRYAGNKPLLENLNVPLCAEGQVRGLARVELSEVADNSLDAQDCTSVEPQADDDITAFVNGFATISSVPLEQRAA